MDHLLGETMVTCKRGFSMKVFARGSNLLIKLGFIL